MVTNSPYIGNLLLNKQKTFYFHSFPFICSYIDEQQDKYVQRLADAVAIKSVSAWPDHRHYIVQQVEAVAEVTYNIQAS